jgi:NAD(P)-dependent dehydrogenase (short-subunit alcohol dehydrogenase family)
MDLHLSGKRAVIAGGSKGIGLAIAHALAAEGADVALVARDRAALDAARDEVVTHGNRVLAISADTTDDAAVVAMIEQVVEEWGGVDILVNTAAEPAKPGAKKNLADLTDDGLRLEIETKVLGYLRTARAAAPYMIANGWGRIINVAGLAARSTGSTWGTVRNVSVAAITKNLADELGPQGINVVVVHPSVTVTERLHGLMAAQAESEGITLAQVEERYAAGNSVRRIITAENVADVVTFLASPRSIAINGDAIAVGGGIPGAINY